MKNIQSECLETNIRDSIACHSSVYAVLVYSLIINILIIMDTVLGHQNNCSGEVVITSRILVKTSCIESFMEIAKTIVEVSRAEEGCIEYEFLQNPFQPEAFFFYEVYKNSEAQSFHSKQEYLKDFKELRKPMLQQLPELKIYRAVEF